MFWSKTHIVPGPSLDVPWLSAVALKMLWRDKLMFALQQWKSQANKTKQEICLPSPVDLTGALKTKYFSIRVMTVQSLPLLVLLVMIYPCCYASAFKTRGDSTDVRVTKSAEIKTVLLMNMIRSTLRSAFNLIKLYLISWLRTQTCKHPSNNFDALNTKKYVCCGMLMRS